MNDLTLDLDLDISSLPDPEGFGLPPTGQYIGRASLNLKDIGGTQRLMLDLVIDETVELDNPDETVGKRAKVDMMFNLTPEGLSFAKPKLAKFAQALQVEGKVSTLLEAVQDVSVEFVLKHRKVVDKQTKEVKLYPSIPDATFNILG